MSMVLPSSRQHCNNQTGLNSLSCRPTCLRYLPKSSAFFAACHAWNVFHHDTHFPVSFSCCGPKTVISLTRCSPWSQEHFDRNHSRLQDGVTRISQKRQFPVSCVYRFQEDCGLLIQRGGDVGLPASKLSPHLALGSLWFLVTVVGMYHYEITLF